MTTLLLVRHGETVWHGENRYAGRTDVALTSRGRDQAAELAAWVARAGVDAVWSSPLSRARETAEPSARAAGRPLRLDERLVELDFGAAEGLTRSEMAGRFPGALAAFEADPDAHHLPHGEPPPAAVARASACLDAIAGECPHGRVLVVSHTTLIRLLLCRFLGIPLSEYRRRFPCVANCSLTEIRLGPDGVALLQFNAPVAGHAGAEPGEESADDRVRAGRR